MGQVDQSLLGRLSAFRESFGTLGLILMFCAACVVVAIALWRGPGLMLFVLFLTYATGAIAQGGIIFLSTVVRWFFLGLLGLMIFRKHPRMKFTMIFVIIYLLLGFLGNIQSPVFMWTIQQTVLLAMAILFIPIAVNSYVTDFDKVAKIFKMGIAAATVWIAANIMFLGEFRYATEERFTSSEGIGAVVVAYSGVFFAPMIVWGILQSRYKIWKLYSMVLMVPFLVVLLVGAVRSALLGMVLIASIPILVAKLRPTKLIAGLGVFCFMLAASVYGLFAFFPAKAQVLYERLLTTSTTGRSYVWVWALEKCVNEALWGHGIGSADIVGRIQFGMFFHNAYLQVWYNSGFFGLVAILVFIGIYVLKSLRLAYFQPATEIKEYGSVALGYMLGIIATSMFEGVFATAGGIGITMLMITAAIIDRLGQMQADTANDNLDQTDEYDLPDWSLQNA